VSRQAENGRNSFGSPITDEIDDLHGTVRGPEVICLKLNSWCSATPKGSEFSRRRANEDEIVVLGIVQGNKLPRLTRTADEAFHAIEGVHRQHFADSV